MSVMEEKNGDEVEEKNKVDVSIEKSRPKLAKKLSKQQTKLSNNFLNKENTNGD